MNLIERLQLSYPIIQAPMAGVSTPALAAAVSEAGGLGSIGIGATDVPGARAMIEELRQRTSRPFNVNLFVHAPPQRNVEKESAWLTAMSPLFKSFDAQPPTALREIYQSFATNDQMLDLLLELVPPVVSFHFGLPDQQRIVALKKAGCVLLSTATNLTEAQAAKDAGIDAIVAQGFEAGGHRGIFNPAGGDPRLGTLALTRLLASRSELPVIAAGGIMDGRGIRAALTLGAVAAQLGTAFILCPESTADKAYREALSGPAAFHTVMTDRFSGRPARCLPNRFTDWAAKNKDLQCPDYPIAYDAAKAINTAAKAKGESGFAAQWAGQGAPLARNMPAAQLIATLASEM